MALLRWLFGDRKSLRDKASFRDAVALDVPSGFYPTVHEITERLRASRALREDALNWAAQVIHQKIREGAGYSSSLNAVVRAGNEITAAEKQRIGASSRTRIGSDFYAAMNSIDFATAKEALFIAIQQAVSVAAREYNLQQMLEIGVTHVRLLPTNDERDCAEAKRRNGELFPIDDARLPLEGCDAPYCRCLFQADIDLDDYVSDRR